MTTTLTTKTCGSCCRDLDLSAFYRDSGHSTGYQRSCKECQKASARARHEVRRPEALAQMKVHYREDIALRPEHYKARSRRLTRLRRARLRTSDCREVSERDWSRLVARYGGLCAYCQAAPWQERDHIIPVSRGGRHSIGNLLPACKSCNCTKATRLLVEWKR